MIYLASPYSHPDPNVRERRFWAACYAAAELLEDGEIVFSPIAHGHAIGTCGLPEDWRYWQRYDCEYLSRCDEVVVLRLENWHTSKGVRAEIRLAQKLGIPVRYIDPIGSRRLSRTALERGDG